MVRITVSSTEFQCFLFPTNKSRRRDAFTGEYYVLEPKRVHITYSPDKRMTVPFLCQLSLSPTMIT